MGKLSRPVNSHKRFMDEEPRAVSLWTRSAGDVTPGVHSFLIDRDQLISLGKLAHSYLGPSLVLSVVFDLESHSIRHYTISEWDDRWERP